MTQRAALDGRENPVPLARHLPILPPSPRAAGAKATCRRRAAFGIRFARAARAPAAGALGERKEDE